MSNKEYEVRIVNIDTNEFRKKLKKFGAKIDNPKKLMPSIIFFHPNKINQNLLNFFHQIC